MKKNNEILCLIIKLLLSVFIAFIFAFKYKQALLSALSEPVYYQLLVVVTIISGFLANPIGYCTYNCYIFARRKISKEYNAEYLSEQLKLLSKTNPKKISEEHKEMIKSWGGRDPLSEVKIESVTAELDRLRKSKTGQTTPPATK
ncbi:hypothetical protein [Cronobacter sakazakii]|uniref:hypothetical protein n=1 Tax=Cronobacter sakazakii TaxID=28141 RepID=UPI000CFAF87F|nr:hypothetical protein [Cronobacter sakazakii]EJH8728839.1 hypothetical protein [Cronobacter sakazakii]